MISFASSSSSSFFLPQTAFLFRSLIRDSGELLQNHRCERVEMCVDTTIAVLLCCVHAFFTLLFVSFALLRESTHEEEEEEGTKSFTEFF